MLDARGIARILNAVGSDVTPAGLDKAALRRSLEWGATWHRTIGQLRPSKRAKLQLRLWDIKTAAKRLTFMLSNDDAWRAISPELPLIRDCPRATLKDLFEAVDRILRPQDVGAGTKDLFKARSPLEWLVGKYLPGVFKRHFDRRPAFSRQGGVPSGPYIRFVEQVLAELEIRYRGHPYQLETIAKAFDDARHDRVRSRRHKSAVNVGQN
jgi:hypothetical protein